MQISDLLQMVAPVQTGQNLAGTNPTGFAALLAEALDPPGAPPPDGLLAIASGELKTVEPNAQSKKPDPVQVEAEANLLAAFSNPVPLVVPPAPVVAQAAPLAATQTTPVSPVAVTDPVPDMIGDRMAVVDARTWTEPLASFTKAPEFATEALETESPIVVPALSASSEPTVVDTFVSSEELQASDDSFMAPPSDSTRWESDGTSKTDLRSETPKAFVPETAAKGVPAGAEAGLVPAAATTSTATDASKPPAADMASNPSTVVATPGPEEPSKQPETKTAKSDSLPSATEQTSSAVREGNAIESGVKANRNTLEPTEATESSDPLTESGKADDHASSQSDTHKRDTDDQEPFGANLQPVERPVFARQEPAQDKYDRPIAVDGLRERTTAHADRVAIDVRRGVELLLETHDFGTLSIELMQQGSNLEAQFVTENRDLSAALAASQSHLHNSVTAKGLNLAAFEVGANQQTSSDLTHRQGQPREHAHTTNFLNRHTTTANGGWARSSAEGLDLWI